MNITPEVFVEKNQSIELPEYFYEEQEFSDNDEMSFS